MNERTKLGAAVLGGYVLGRTKKGATALRFAMWLNGTSSGSLARQGVQQLSPQMTRIATEMGQPLLSAARKAAVASVEARLSGMADSLNQRTNRLLPDLPGSGDSESSTDDAEMSSQREDSGGADANGDQRDEDEERADQGDELDERDDQRDELDERDDQGDELEERDDQGDEEEERGDQRDEHEERSHQRKPRDDGEEHDKRGRQSDEGEGRDHQGEGRSGRREERPEASGVKGDESPSRNSRGAPSNRSNTTRRATRRPQPAAAGERART